MVLLRIYKQGLNGTIVNRQVKRGGGGAVVNQTNG